MQAFEYANPTTIQEAVGMLGSGWGDANILAGGTDLLSLMKDCLQTPRRVVSIKNVKELGGIAVTKTGVRIGAAVTLDELASNATIRQSFPSIVTAALGVVSPQIRNTGTVGGDLCQRPRCWYFRMGFGLLGKDQNGNALVPNGENEFHAILGNSGPAYFVSASSFGPPLIALGAKVKIASASGSRDLAVEKLFVNPKSDSERETALAPGDLLTEILIPFQASRNATYEIRQRKGLDWPLATASVCLRMKGTTVASARVVLGHVAPVPWPAPEAEQMLAGKSITEDVAEQAGRAALAGATPLSGNAYKVQLARVAVKRALLEAARGRA